MCGIVLLPRAVAAATGRRGWGVCLVVPLLLIAVAFLLASAWWPARAWPARAQAALLVLLAGCLYALPWVPGARDAPVLPRALLTLASCAVLGPKLLDAYFSRAAWRERAAREWLAYLANPFVLVYRAHLRDPAGETADSVRRALGGLLRMLAGVGVLLAAFRIDFTGGSFWVEHSVKTLGAYLVCFDGQFVAATGVMRLVAGRSLEFSRNPVLAHSPADFWRRYNRDAGRFLYMDVLVPLVARRSLVLGTAAVFAANGVLHEYLAFALSGRIAGYQLAFFGVQGAATVLTLGWRPRGRMRAVGTLATLLFTLATSALFFASVDLLVDWYDTSNPLAWR